MATRFDVTGLPTPGWADPDSLDYDPLLSLNWPGGDTADSTPPPVRVAWEVAAARVLAAVADAVATARPHPPPGRQRRHGPKDDPRRACEGGQAGHQFAGAVVHPHRGGRAADLHPDSGCPVTRPYAFHVEAYLAPVRDWRWRRAEELIADDPHAGRYTDDLITLSAVRFLKGDPDPALIDVRNASRMNQAGGLQRAVVEAYLLTDLSEQDIGERTGMSGAAVAAFTGLFFCVRGDDPLSRFHRAEAVQPGDRLRAAAVQWGPRGVEAEAAWQAGGFGLSPELMEAFERRELLDKLYDANPKAFLRAVDRMRAMDAGLQPGVMHRSG